MARQGEDVSFKMCEYSLKGQGCPNYTHCKILHKKGTDWGTVDW